MKKKVLLRVLYTVNVNSYKSIGFNILDEQINDDTGSIEYYMKK